MYNNNTKIIALERQGIRSKSIIKVRRKTSQTSMDNKIKSFHLILQYLIPIINNITKYFLANKTHRQPSQIHLDCSLRVKEITLWWIQSLILIPNFHSLSTQLKCLLMDSQISTNSTQWWWETNCPIKTWLPTYLLVKICSIRMIFWIHLKLMLHKWKEAASKHRQMKRESKIMVALLNHHR